MIQLGSPTSSKLSLACLMAALGGFLACTGDEPVVGTTPGAKTPDAGGGTTSSSSSGALTDAGGNPDTGPAGPCNLAADFGTPTKIVAASSLDLDQQPTLTDNELTLYFVRGGKIFSVSRANANADFEGPPKEIADVDTDPTLYWQSAMITRDGQSLVLGQKKLFFSTMSGGKFSTPVAVSAGGDVSGEHPYVTFDQSAVYFNGPSGAAQGLKRASISSTTAWSNVTALTELGTPARYPVVTADEQTLYFSSSRSGGKGGDDIYVSKRESKTAPWGEPMLLPGPINSDGDEAPSWLSSDGCRLYVVIAGSGSINYDIYVSTRPH